MNRYLLDTNALIALLDSEQPFSESTAKWFYADVERRWLTCPITENGSVRVLSLQSYPNPQPIPDTIESLRTLIAFGRHEHIADDVSLFDPEINPRRLHGSGQITDTYLTLLAQAHGAIFATLDRRLSTAAIKAPVEVFQIPTE